MKVKANGIRIINLNSYSEYNWMYNNCFFDYFDYHITFITKVCILIKSIVIAFYSSIIPPVDSKYRLSCVVIMIVVSFHGIIIKFTVVNGYTDNYIVKKDLFAINSIMSIVSAPDGTTKSIISIFAVSLMQGTIYNCFLAFEFVLIVFLLF